MSVPIENKPTNFEDVSSSENICPLSMVAAYSKAIEPQIGQDGISMLSLAAITMVGKLFDGTNAEEMYTSLKEILNGKCQKQNSSEILAFWRSLQSKLEKLSESQLKDLLFTFLGKVLNEGMKCKGTISIFKITDMFFETCNLFVKRFETDNGDRFDKENNNLKIPMVPLVHEESLKSNQAVAGTEEAVDRYNTNLSCCKRSLSVSPRNSNEDIILKNSEECEVNEVSSSQQELCETLTQKSVKSGEVTTQPELDTILDTHASQVSEPSEAEISSVGETQAHGASGENNCGRLHKKRSLSSKKEASLMQRTKTHEVSAPSDAEISLMEETQAHGASGENNSKTSQEESIPSISKVSAPSEAEVSLMGEIQAHSASGENNSTTSQKQSTLSISKASKEEMMSFVGGTQLQGVRGGKKPREENKPSKGEAKINGVYQGKSAKKPEKESTQNKISEPIKESVWIMETESHGRLVTGKPGKDNQNNEVLPSSSSEASSQILVPASRKADKIFKKPNELPVTAHDQQTSYSEQPRMVSKPVQDELSELKAEMERIQAEHFKTRKKDDQKMEEIKKLVIQQQNEIQILWAKNVALDDMNNKLFHQIDTKLRPRLQQLEELYYSRINFDL